mmetsp:Transcript_50289/g.112957  ORF Transcript_50289/g.112957 Transcript_50289/m.112957 type:complete len:242 (-) Transcript_50289:42-767(-)
MERHPVAHVAAVALAVILGPGHADALQHLFPHERLKSSVVPNRRHLLPLALDAIRPALHAVAVPRVGLPQLIPRARAEIIAINLRSFDGAQCRPGWAKGLLTHLEHCLLAGLGSLAQVRSRCRLHLLGDLALLLRVGQASWEGPPLRCLWPRVSVVSDALVLVGPDTLLALIVRERLDLFVLLILALDFDPIHLLETVCLLPRLDAARQVLRGGHAHAHPSRQAGHRISGKQHRDHDSSLG